MATITATVFKPIHGDGYSNILSRLLISSSPYLLLACAIGYDRLKLMGNPKTEERG
jgi:hypothetical protein